MPEDVADRVCFARANVEAAGIMLAGYRRESGDPNGEVVVVVIDVRDPMGRDLVGPEGAQEALRIAGPDEIPTAVAVLPLVIAREIFRVSHPKVARALREEPPPGRLRVLGVASGGVTLMHLEVEEVVEAGEA